MFGLDPGQLLFVIVVTLIAAFIKGAVGFAMPMIMMSVFTIVLPAPVALALLILPTFVTNLSQALRQGLPEALASARRFRLHIIAIVVALIISAQFMTSLPKPVMEGLLGAPVLGLALWQLAGRSMTIRIEHRDRAEVALGLIGGLFGGVSGIWGPPLIILLLSLGTGKQEMMRVQGVVFLIGSAALFAAHLFSGVLTAQTLPLSAMLVVPALVGMRLGQAVQDRLDPGRFRRWTLILLALTGGNLLWHALA